MKYFENDIITFIYSICAVFFFNVYSYNEVILVFLSPNKFLYHKKCDTE